MLSTGLFIGSTGYLTHIYAKYLDEARRLEKGESVGDEEIKRIAISEYVKLESEDSVNEPPIFLHFGTVAGLAVPVSSPKHTTKSNVIYSHVKYTRLPDRVTNFTRVNPTILSNTELDCKSSYINTPEDLTNRCEQFNIDRSSLRLRLPLKLSYVHLKTTTFAAFADKSMNTFAFSSHQLSRHLAKKRVNTAGLIPLAAVAACSLYQIVRGS